ncbi:MAG TPA: helix-turn-helix transcriptional regulator [Anaerolineales bacterium]|nr:helix-turn-helix transcriptional regulator [Anaerolineales bacterium]
MSILDFLLNLIGKRPDNSPRTYELSEDLKVMLTRLAEREGRPEHELTSDLVAAGLIQYLATDELRPKWKSLSAREKDVAKLISQGLTNRQMAAQLSLSTETINTHVQNIMRKFGVDSKAELRHILGVVRFSD